MRRRLLNLLTLLSLLLCVAVVALWVRSYQAHDVLTWTRADVAPGSRWRWYRVVASGRGLFAYSCDAEVYQRSSVTPEEAARPLGRWQWEGWQRGFVGYPAPGFGGQPNLRWGFHFAWRGDLPTVRHEVVVPYWAIALPAVALPAWWLLRKLRPAARPGTCPRCGYDLCATPDRCPECGAQNRAIIQTDPLPDPAVHGEITWYGVAMCHVAQFRRERGRREDPEKRECRCAARPTHVGAA